MSIAALRWTQSVSVQPLAVSLGVDEKVSLQVHLKASNRFATRWVGDHGQFVENSSAKVISHHRETIIRAAQLQGNEERKKLPLADSHMILAKKARSKDSTPFEKHTSSSSLSWVFSDQSRAAVLNRWTRCGPRHGPRHAYLRASGLSEALVSVFTAHLSFTGKLQAHSASGVTYDPRN